MADDPRDGQPVLSDNPPPVDDAATDAVPLPDVEVRDDYVGEGGKGDDEKAGDA